MKKCTIKRTNSVACILFLIAGFGLLSSSRMAVAYNQNLCPPTQHEPQGCIHKYILDIGYYGCSSSGDVIGCCEYDNYEVYCADTEPIKKIGVMQKRTNISNNTQCDGHYCVVPQVSV